MSQIKQVAVLGAGVMGSQIAAHLTNCGVGALLYDLNQELAEQGIATARKLKPSPFYDSRTYSQIKPCNYDDHPELLQDVDWVVEVIAERLDWKQQLYQRIVPHLHKDAVISSNTSGILLQDLTAGLPDDVANRFIITHFFNPPRYLPLVEIVAGKMSGKPLDNFIEFLQGTLGKRVVMTNDTPNFIANRLGIFGLLLTMRKALEYGLSITDTDALTGSLLGRPKSATFRTADVVGLDTVVHVTGTSRDHSLEELEKGYFTPPEFLQQLVDDGRLGQKSGAGFYKKIGKGVIHELNPATLDYQPAAKSRFDGVRLAKNWKDFGRSVSALYYSDDKSGRFIFDILSETFLYAVNYMPHFAENLQDIDHSMMWGYGWQHGLFETWDMLGIQRSLKAMQERHMSLGKAESIIQHDAFTFFRWHATEKQEYDFTTDSFHLVKEKPDLVERLAHQGPAIVRNWSASFRDAGDGVGLVDFHSILQPGLNPIDGSILETITAARDHIRENRWQALVIGHEGEHFSAGANIAMILEMSQKQQWDQIEEVTRAFQDLNQSLRFAPFPVVAAPFNLCLGGGVELVAACDRIVASAELYAGLVEVGVGLIPGGGGNLRLLLNFRERMAKGVPGPFPVVQKAFESIAFAKIATSAREAIQFGFLQKTDEIVVPRARLLERAIEVAREMAAEYEAPAMCEDIILPGIGGRLAIESTVDSFKRKGVITEYDALLGNALANVLTGGDRGGEATPVNEQYLLDLEREVFVGLCANPQTQARLGHMLKTGKPLRN